MDMIKATLVVAAIAQGTMGSALPAGAKLFGRSTKMQCNRGQPDIDLINSEITYASNNAKNTAVHLLDKANNDYWETFFPESLRNAGKSFEDQMTKVYQNLAGIASSDQTSYEITITCDNDATKCQSGHFPFMNDKKKTMNLCDIWFDNSKISKTRDAIRDCQSSNPSFKTLGDFRLTKSNVLLHEWTHTSYGMGSNSLALDYAYAVNDCVDLAAGKFTRTPPRYKQPSKGPLCPDPSDKTKEGVCDANLASDNADTIALVSTGIFYSQSCGAHVPIAGRSGSSSSSKVRRVEAFPYKKRAASSSASLTSTKKESTTPTASTKSAKQSPSPAPSTSPAPTPVALPPDDLEYDWPVLEQGCCDN